MNTIKDVFNTVLNFIVSHKLILYGGMSIDYALKLQGLPGIYDDNEEPDYDVYTHDMTLCYDLADLLAKTYDNIDVINAFHPQTLRIRYNKVIVVDMSFMPLHIFDIIPTLNYITSKDVKGKILKIIHPVFKLADSHKAFLTPIKDIPSESVHFRFKKDMVRFNLIDEAYPNSPIVSSKRMNVNFNIDVKIDVLISGLYAYCLIVEEFESIFENNKCDYLKVNKSKKGYDVEFIDEVKPILVITDSTSFKKSDDYKAPWMDDLIPRSITTDQYIFYEYGLSVTYHQVKEHKILNIHGVMLYFLTKSMMSGNFKKSPYYQYYVSLKNIIKYVQEPFIQGGITELLENSLTKDSPFFINMNIFAYVEPPEYLIKIHELKNKRFGIRELVWPLAIYTPGYNRPMIKDHILLKIGYEPLNNFKAYEDLKKYGDVY